MPMNLGLQHGAVGVVPDLLADVLKQRMLERELQRRLAQDAAEQEAMRKRLALEQQRVGFEGERLGLEKGREAREVELFPIEKRGKQVGVETAETALADTKLGISRREASRENPVVKGLVPYLDVGARLGAVDPTDPTGEVAHKNRLAEIAAQGDISLAVARQYGANVGLSSPYVHYWSETVTNDEGKDVSRHWGLTRNGEKVLINEAPKGMTADIKNRQAYIQDFSSKLEAFDAMVDNVATYSTQDDWSTRLGRATIGGIKQFTAEHTPWGTAVDPEAAMFVNLQSGLAMTGARILGSNSQLSDAEREAAKASLFPKLTEPIEVMKAKIRFWRTVSRMGDDARQADAVRQALSGVFDFGSGQTEGSSGIARGTIVRE